MSNFLYFFLIFILTLFVVAMLIHFNLIDGVLGNTSTRYETQAHFIQKSLPYVLAISVLLFGIFHFINK